MEQSKSPSDSGRKLRLLSFNIQAGTSTYRYHHYVTQGWRQVLPHSRRVENLDAIADLVTPYDMVALQEVDSGSLRSGFINQSRYLATHAGMPFWCHQSNRKVGAVAYAGNGFLGRYEPDAVEEHRLPGVIPGRGSLVVRFGGESGLVIAIVHLALGRRARGLQLDYLTRQLDSSAHLVVMGDLNTLVSSKQIMAFRESLGLDAPTEGLASYPSWQPQRAIDHILVSSGLTSCDAGVLDVTHSDHCPVQLTIDLPEGIDMQETTRPVVSIEARGPDSV